MVESTTSESSPAKTPATSVMSAAFSVQAASLKNQLRHFSSRSDVVAVLLKFVSQTFSTAAARLDFRVRERTEITLQSVPSMPKELAQKFNDKWLGPLALEVQTDTDHSARSKIYEREGQAIFIASAAILDQESRIPDGAISMLIMGRPEDGKQLVAQLETLATVTAQRLAELAANRFVSYSDFPLRSRTAGVEVEQLPVAQVSSHPPHGNESARVKSASETQPSPHTIAPPNTISAGSLAPNTGRNAIPGESLNTEHAQSVHELNPAALGKIAAHGSPREFAFSIVNALANQCGAEQVAFGITSGQRILLLAISGLTDFKPSSPGVSMMTQAMEECLDFGSLIAFPMPAGTDMPPLPIHRRWSAEAGAASVCSVPLSDSNGVSAVVSLRRTATRPFTKEELSSLTRTLQPYGHALRMLDRATRPLQQQVKFAARESLQKSFAAGSTGRLGLIGGVVLLGLWLVFGALTYRPICTARVVAENMVQMTAASNAKLLKSYVQPGQEVQAGQLLAEFDTTETTLQLQSLEREIASAEVEVRRSITIRDTSSAALHKARVGVLMTQAAGLQERLERARLVAPENGTIVRADLEKRIGQMFAPGDIVLEFAPKGGWNLEIQVPDDIGTLVQPSQIGTFAAASYSSHSMPFEIQYVGGTAQVVDGNNVFIAQAPLAERPEWMKSGMEGTARISTVEKPVWWVLAHRVIDWCRLSFWI
ncbi:MAG: HlyD family efflux transporter periplasmic adaptor subunit [Planctomycetaceae bacterium]